MKKVEVENEEIENLVEHYAKSKQKEAEKKRGLFEYF